MSVMEKQVVEVQEKLEDITECPICTETFKEPKILPCIHTFCMTCCQETGLKTGKCPGDRMSCPVCRTDFTVPEIGFSGLQRNFFMERLIEMKNILNSSSTRVVCDACQEDNDLGAEAEIPPAAMYCADCNQRLCEECCKIHRKYKATKGHRMLTLDGSQINSSSIVKPYICDKHENKPLEIYCLSCQEVVCALCFYTSHKAHDTSPVVEVITDYRRIIQENADSMMKLCLDIKHKTAGKDNAKEMFAAKVVDVESEIKTIEQNLQACAKRDCNSLLLKLKSFKEERIKRNEIQLCDIETAVASLESYQAYCAQLTSIGSDVDICRAVHNLSTRAAELKQHYESVSFEPFPDIRLKKTEFHDVLYQTGKSIIGKIEEFGDDQALQAESKESLIDRISSLVNEVNGILDKITDKAEQDVCQSKETEQILEHSDLPGVEADDEGKPIGNEEHQNCVYGMEKGRSVAFERIAVDEMKESMTCVDKLSDKLKETKIKINILLKRYDKLTKEMRLERKNASKLLEENHVLCDQAEHIKLTRMKSDQEIIDLRKQVALLTSIAYDGDKTPKGKNVLQQRSGLGFLQTFTAVDVPNQLTYRVTGLAILDNELFVANNSNIVEVNDLRTLKFKRRWRAEQLVRLIVDMKASVLDKYVYLLCTCNSISDKPTWYSFEEVHMFRYSAGGKVINKWKLDSVKGAHNAQISITGESNVLVTDGFGSKLIEYSPDGKLMHVVSLKWEAGIQHLTHAIKLTSDHFMICHGEGNDSLQRVCIVDIDGNVLKYFGEMGISHYLKCPVYLEMSANGNILVADHFNRRLLVLSSNLALIQELNPHNSKYSSATLDRSILQSKPRKLILDEANGRLFVAENIWNVPSGGKQEEQYGDQLSAFTFSMQ